VWHLLAELAARGAGDRPGRGFRPPRAWRVPRAWLEPFADDRPWRLAARDDGGVLLLHPAGFAVVDAVPADLERELRRYRVARTGPGRCGRARGTGLDGWVDRLARYVRARLALALGVPAAAAPRLAFRRPANVHVTDTRIDVVSSLGDLPIEVRLAGLD